MAQGGLHLTNVPNQAFVSDPTPVAGVRGSPQKKRSSTARILLSAGIGCAVLLVAGIVVGVLVVRWLLQEPENVVISVNVPEKIRKGRQFTFDVVVRNTAARPQLLHSIDIYDDLLAAVAIERTDPPFTEVTPLPADDTVSYEFKQTIPAGETATVRFHARAREAGDFQSFADICINSGVSFLTWPIGIVIEE